MMLKKFSIFFFMIVLLKTTFGIANAQEAEVQYVVDTITFLSDKNEELTDPTLPLIIAHKVGKPLSTDHLLTDIQQLLVRFPVYSDITTEVKPTDIEKHVAITFTFHKKRTVAKINFSIQDTVEEVLELKNKLNQKEDVFFKPSLIDEDIKLLTSAYKTAGYPDVKVSYTVSENAVDANLADITYSIKSEKQKQYIKKIILPKTVIKESTLKKYIQSKGTNLFGKQVLNVIQLDADKNLLQQLLITEGYRSAKVSYKIEVIESKKKKAFGKNNIVFTIEPGARISIKTVTITGNKVYKTEELQAVMSVTGNSAYSEKEIRKSLQAIRELYGEKGYALVKVDADYNQETELLSFTIKEGLVQYITDIQIFGNESMKQSIILKDVSFVPSEIVDSRKISKTLRKMQRTGYYEHVQINYSPLTHNTGKVIIQVAEAQNQVIEFGAGYSSSGFGGDIGYSNPNIFNSGKGINISATKSEEMTRLRLLYHDPHFAGTDVQMSTALTYNDREYEHFRNAQIGMQLTFKKLITQSLKMGVGARVNFINIKEVSSALEAEVADAAGRATLVGLVGTLAYKKETIAANGDVKSGIRLKMSLYPSYVDQAVYLKTYVEAVHTAHLGTNKQDQNHTLTSRVTLGYATNNTPFYEKFYAGGVGSVRGYKNNKITPDNNLTGGNALLDASINYSFPIWKDMIKGVVFVDAAFVSEADLGNGQVKVAAGFGVRANLRKTFLNTVMEAGFAFAIGEENSDIKRPFYFIMGDYDPAYDM